jgi:pimeloyl-ACP methyl ester carboxylesterase
MRSELRERGPAGLLQVWKDADEIPARAKRDAAWGRKYETRFLANRPRDLQWALDAILGMDNLTDRLAALRVPVLAVVGERDAPLRASVADYAPRIPACEIVVVAGVSHCPNVDAPEEFNRVLIRFLDRSRSNENGSPG